MAFVIINVTDDIIVEAQRIYNIDVALLTPPARWIASFAPGPLMHE
jgi:hypothetical protein